MIKIGKHTLESLTNGMYNNPYVIFREYIQNATDAIDEAIKLGLIVLEDSYINIILNQENSEIIIEDNGTGIKSKEVFKTLTDLGNSNKKITTSKGFRGIGRLSGLSYCKKLTFETSYKNEKVKSVLTFDAEKLHELLIPGKYEKLDVYDVINEIVEIKYFEDNLEAHYFLVRMEGVYNKFKLFEGDKVKDYLCQVAPLPYDTKKFGFAEKIYYKEELLNLPRYRYNIYLKKNKGLNFVKLFKPYKNKFTVNKSNKHAQTDVIEDIEFKEIRNKNNSDLLALVWYGKCNLLGSILEQDIKGLRLRKSNILIGDEYTLKDLFKEDRFNGWIQGEVLIYNSNLIPNARRDDFERNEEYFELLDQLKQIAGKISSDIREASKQRNKNSEKKQQNNNGNNNLIKKIDQLIELSSHEKYEKIRKVLEKEVSQDKVDRIMNNIYNLY